MRVRAGAAGTKFSFIERDRRRSSFGRAPRWYRGGGRIEAGRRHHARVAELADAPHSECDGLDPWRFKSSRAHQIAPVAERVDARCSKQRTLQVRVLPGVRARSSEAERPAYTGKAGVSKSSARTTSRVRSSVVRAPSRHGGGPWIVPRRTHHAPVAQW